MHGRSTLADNDESPKRIEALLGALLAQSVLGSEEAVEKLAPLLQAGGFSQREIAAYLNTSQASVSRTLARRGAK